MRDPLRDARRPGALSDPDVLLGVLEAAPDATASDREILDKALSAPDVAVDDVCGWIERWPPLAGSSSERAGWLHEVATLHRIQRGLSTLEAKSLDPVRSAAESQLQACRGQVEAIADAWRFAGSSDEVPWSWLRSATVGDWLARHPNDLAEAVSLWVVRQLHEADARLLCERRDEETLDLLSPSVLEGRSLHAPHVHKALQGGAGDIKVAVAELEKSSILAALSRHEGNKSRAAQDLGISRFALQRKLEKYGIGATDIEAASASGVSEDESGTGRGR